MAANDPNPSDQIATVPFDGQQEDSPSAHVEMLDVPERIGRYRVQSILGKGGFGLVYLAHDEQLNRPVAVKVPRADLIVRRENVELYLAEARAIAGLDHPNIVPVYDVGSTDQFPCYVVSKYVEGTDLATKRKVQRCSYLDAAEWVTAVAEALHHAHRQGLVHRDIKPGNILIDKAGKPFVTDFGMALREQDVGKGPRFAGTPAYMSPEQARGEGHRVDGRSDIFSVGVVLYELLVGHRPFRAESAEELLEQIGTLEPRPPRQHEDRIPKELERICLKALSKRCTERYTTAKDLADDLRHFLMQSDLAHVSPRAPRQEPAATVAVTPGLKAPATPSNLRPIKIVPKGLRSFDAHDADFFLELLPGPCDREGLPESIRFWKTRIEETDADAAFPVGLVYGPSGCGKSSLVKAGLVPRLASQVIAVYVEATATDTEARLLKAVRNHCLDLPAGQSLTETVAVLRRGRELPGGKKLVIVLDQFEQWLHANRRRMEGSDLAGALRQADGRRVQFLLLVRDDFWVAISRLFQELEIALVDGQNLRLADRFDPRHARRVLQLFGQAYGCLPERSSEFTADQNAFLDQVVAGLSEDGKVVSVRVSLLADMMKGRPWTPQSLRAVGGLEGIGVTFFEETFSSRTASPEHRALEKPARGLLAALLPDAGTDIKGQMRSHAELLAATGLGSQPRRFNQLLAMLDRELRIITPTEAEQPAIGDQVIGDRSETAAAVEPGSPDHRLPITGHPSSFYQLTHDYLVPPLRQWLTQKKRETWRGRAELRLEQRAAQWIRTRERRFLPSLLEYLSILFGMPRRNRTGDQRRLMRAAGRHHGVRWAAVLVVLIAAAVAIQQYAGSIRHVADQRRAESLVEAFFSAPPAGVPYAIEKLESLHELAIPLLRIRLADLAANPLHRLHAAYALAAFGQRDSEVSACLIESVPTAMGGEAANIVNALRPMNESVSSELMVKASDAAEPQTKARYAALALFLGEPQAAQRLLALGPDPSGRTAFVHGFVDWRVELSALSDILRKTDDSAFRSGACAAVGTVPYASLTDEEQRSLAAVFREFYTDAPDGATHSAAGWALRQWKVELPSIEPSAGPRSTAPSPQPSPPEGRGSQKYQPSPRAAGGEGRVRGWFVNRHGLTMLEIPPGKFTLGDADWQSDAAQPPHEVTLTRPFFICDREVSLDLFQQFMNDPDYPATEKPQNWRWDENAARVSPSGDCPAHSVSWFDAVLFCNWLSQKEGRQPCYKRGGKETVKPDENREEEWDVWSCDFEANGYRLPTEAEWEYGCRALAGTAFCFGNDELLLPKYAFLAVNAKSRSWPGGSLLPNGWGLFDMHGNISEWCWDRSAAYSEAAVTDPHGPETGQSRLLRGGAWFVYPQNCRSAIRLDVQPPFRYVLYGLRVVCGGGGVAARTQ